MSSVMKPSEAQPTEIVDFRAERYLPDGKNIVVSFATKQSGERQSYTLPVASLYSFIADLQKLQSAGRPVQGATAPAAAPVEPSLSPAPPAATSNRIEVIVPRKWMARGLPERNMVLMIFDPRSERQAAYALPPGAAREMAAGLVKEAEKLAKAASDKAALGRSETG